MVYRQMFRLLPIQILLCAVAAVNNIVSSCFATNFIGVDAMSAVGLYGPINTLLTACSTVLTVGSAILCGKYMGENRMDRMQGCFGLNLLLTFLLSLLFAVFFTSFALLDLTGFITHDDTVRSVFNRYLLGQVIGVFPFVLGNQLSTFLSLENRQRRTLFASVVYIGLNLVLNYLFVGILDLQAFGLALASSLGMWVFCGIQASYYFSGKSPLRICLTGFSWRESGEILRTGIPGALSNWYQTFRGQIVNQLLLTYVGSVGVSAFAAANNLLSLFWAVPVGMLNVSRFLMSVSIGEEDRRTLTNTMRGLFRYYIPLMCLVSAALVACSVPLTEILFHDPFEPVYRMTVWSLRILPLCMPFSLVCIHFVCYGQASGKQVLVHILSLLDGVVCVAGFSAILVPFFGVSGVCAANVLNGIVTVIVIVVYAWVRLKHFPRSMEELMVIPEEFGAGENERMELKVRTAAEVVTVSEKVVAFCRSCGVEERRAYLSGLFLEEMAGNAVEHGFSLDRRIHSAEICVVHKDDDVILRIKDDCPPFDPRKRMPDINPEDRAQNVGIRIVFSLAKDVQYHNTLGLNVLTIRI